MDKGLADVFVSYAREDLRFVLRLGELLEARALRIWVDVDGLYAGEQFWPEICKAIDAAVAVIFVITPHSVASPHCRRELEYAIARQKRLVPVYRHDIGDGQIPPEIAEVHWVLFRDNDDAASAATGLAGAIKADWVWLRKHSRLLVRSEEWRAAGGERSGVLRGHELREAQQWLRQTPDGRERPIELQRQYIGSSERARTRRIGQVALAAAIAMVAVSSAIGAAAFLNVKYLNTQVAQALGEETDENVKRALQLALRAQSWCAYMPTQLYACRAASINLGTAQRSNQHFGESVATFTTVIDDLRVADRTADEWILLADTLWRRSVSRIVFAEALTDDVERGNNYALAKRDLFDAMTIFRRFPEEAAERPLAVTTARLLLANGEYERALSEVAQVAKGSAEMLFVKSLGQICVGDRKGTETLDSYTKELSLSGGTDSPQFLRNRPFLERMLKICLSSRFHAAQK